MNPLLRSIRILLICDSMTLQLLTRLPATADLEPRHRAFVAAVRLWALMRRMRWCPAQLVAEKLESARAAAHFQLMMEELGAAWPDPFCVSPPCSPRLSHDEATLVEMMAIAERGNRPAFDRLLADLIPGDERERLYLSARVLGKALRG
jgi:hypothetical protein